MNSKTKRFLLGGLGLVWLFFTGLYAVYLNRSSGDIVPIVDLVPSDFGKEVSNRWDRKVVEVEGFWLAHVESLSISTSTGSWDQRGPGLLIRPSAGAAKRGFSLSSFLPVSLQGEPVWVSSDDRVRVTGIYHDKGWGAPGTILESCEWLEFDRVEKWDPRRNRWTEADGW